MKRNVPLKPTLKTLSRNNHNKENRMAKRMGKKNSTACSFPFSRLTRIWTSIDFKKKTPDGLLFFLLLILTLDHSKINLSFFSNWLQLQCGRHVLENDCKLSINKWWWKSWQESQSIWTEQETFDYLVGWIRNDDSVASMMNSQMIDLELNGIFEFSVYGKGPDVFRTDIFAIKSTERWIYGKKRPRWSSPRSTRTTPTSASLSTRDFLSWFSMEISNSIFKFGINYTWF